MEKKYTGKWCSSTTVQTYIGKHGTVYICTDDIICGEAEEKQREVLSNMAYNMLYRQAVRESKYDANNFKRQRNTN